MTRSPAISGRRSRRAAGASAAAIIWSLATAANALPTDPVIVGTSGGQGPGATFTPSQGNLTVDQSHQRVVIDWATFNISQGETVTFNQGGVDWIAFNRVDPSAFTTIDGNLNATGGVWLFSPGGLLFGPNASVNVASFLGSTAQLLDADLAAALTADTLTLSPLADRNGATLEVQAGAAITATDGYVVLLGETIVQNGSVVSNSDAVWFGVAEGGQVQIDSNPDGSTLVDATVSAVAGRGRPSLTHGGITTANSWIGIATPGAVESGFETVINLTGRLEADGVRYGTTEGVVILTGADGVIDESAGSVVIDTTAGEINSEYDIYIVGGAVRLGEISGDNIQIDVLADSLIEIDPADPYGMWSTPYSDISLQTTGTGSLIDIGATIYAGTIAVDSAGAIVVEGADIDVRNYVQISPGETSISMTAVDDLTISGDSVLDAREQVILETTGDGVISMGGWIRGSGVTLDGAGGVGIGGSGINSAGAITIRSDTYVDVLAGLFGYDIDIETTGSGSGIFIDAYLSASTISIDGSDYVVLGDEAFLNAGYNAYGYSIDIAAAGDLTLDLGSSLFAPGGIHLQGANVVSNADITGIDISVEATGDITLSATILAYGGIAVLSDAPGTGAGDIVLNGSMSAQGGISIVNQSDGDVTFTSNAVVEATDLGCGFSCKGDGETSLLGADGDIYIYSAGRVITEAGSVIEATGGYGDDVGLLTIVAAGADTAGGAAVDLSGYIDARTVDISTTQGSVRVRSGEISVDEYLRLDSAADLVIDDEASVRGFDEVNLADIYLLADGDILLAGDMRGGQIDILSTGVMSPGETLISVSGDIRAYYDLSVTAWNGDIDIGGDLSARSMDIDAGSDLRVLATATLNAAGTYGEGYGQVYGGDIDLRASDTLTIAYGAQVTADGNVELATREFDSLLDISGLVVGYHVGVYGAADINISGVVAGFTGVAIQSQLGDGVTDADIVISGLLSGPGGVSIKNYNNGDVVLESTAVVSTYYDSGECYEGCEVAGKLGGETALHGLDGDIYIYSAGSVITASGSLIDATGGLGADAGLVTIVSTGADGTNSAIDLSGDIVAERLDMSTTQGSIRLRDGEITVTEDLYIDSALHFIQDAPSVINALPGSYTAATYIRADGDMTFGGTFDGYEVEIVSTGSAVPGGSTIEISGTIFGTDVVEIRNANGDINVASTGVIHSGPTEDNPNPYILLQANGTVSTEAGSQIYTDPAYDFATVAIRSTATDGLGVDLAGDITTSGFIIVSSTYDADVQITGGTLDAGEEVSVNSGGAVNITGGLMTARLVQVRSDRDMLLAGDIEADYALASIYGGESGGVDDSVIRVEGDISAEQSIQIRNEVGDVEIGATGRLYGQLDGAGTLDTAILIVGEQIITEAGSLMRAGALAGPAVGTIELRAEGDDGAVAALDLSGDIDTEALVLDAGTGGMHVRDGQIDVINTFYGVFEGAFVVDEPAVITSETWISVTADGGVVMDGSMYSAGTVTLYSPTAYDVSVGGLVQAADGIVLRSIVGDVALTGDARLHADADGLYGVSDDITIAAGGSVTTAAGTSIQTGLDGAPTGEVYIQSGLASLGAFGIDLSGDITAQQLTLSATGSSIRLRDGDIDVVAALAIDSVGDFLMDAPATITSGDDVDIEAAASLTVVGTITAAADISLLKTGATGGMTVNGALYAGEDVSIINSGGGDLILGGATIVADADGDDPGSDVYISSQNAVIAPGGGSIRVGSTGAPTGDVTILAAGTDAGGFNAIDLSMDIEAINLTLTAANGSIQLASGDVQLNGDFDAAAGVDFLMEAPASLQAAGDVNVEAARAMGIEGQIVSLGGVNVQLQGPGSQDISIGGDIVAGGGIDIENAGEGDVLLAGSLTAASPAAPGGSTALAVPGGVEITSGGAVITAAGSSIQSADFVAISAGGTDSGGFSAIDLSGDIVTGSLELTAGSGSIRLRDGDIAVSDPLTIASGLDFLMDAPAAIYAGDLVNISAARTMTVDGSIIAEGGVDLLLQGPGAQDLSVGGLIDASGIDIENAGSGDVLIGGTLMADGGSAPDPDALATPGGIEITSGGAVITGAASSIQSSASVSIAAGGTGGAGYSAIDLSGDISTASLDLAASNGSIRLRDGVITVSEPLFIASGLDFMMDAPAVIDAEGTVAISAARALVADGAISAGGDVGLALSGPLAQNLSIGGAISSTGDISVENGGSGAVLVGGSLTATGDVMLASGGSVVTGSASVITSGAEVSIAASGGGDSIDLSGDITAPVLSLDADGGSIRLRDGTIAVQSDLVIASALDFSMEAPALIDAASAVQISAGRNMTVDGVIDAGDDVTLLVSGPVAGDLSIGGLITTSGGAYVYNYGGGDILIDGDILADTDGISSGHGDNVVIDSGGRIVTGSGSVIRVGGETTMGAVTLYSYGVDAEGIAAIELSGDIEADYVTVEAYNGSVHLRDGASVGADENAEFFAYAYFVMEQGAAIWGARDRQNPGDPGAWPVLPGTAPGVLIAAADVEIDGQIRAGTESDDATIIISAIDPNGQVTIGGEDNLLGEGFTLSNLEFQNLQAARIVVTAGLGEPYGEGVDLYLADLDLDSSLVSEVWFGTSENLIVEGVVAPTGGGEVDINLGFTLLFDGLPDGPSTAAVEPGQTLVNFIPDNIYISGSLGTVDNPFGVVTLIAQGDVLMGSQAFLEAALADPEFDAFEQSEDLDPEAGHVFVAADGLQIAAMGRVLQQNTGEDGEFGGLVLGLPTSDVQLIFSPDLIEGQTIGGPSGWTANFSAGPQRVELFGVFLDGQEQIGGFDAALVDNLLDPDIALGDDFFNTCLFGSSSECSRAPETPRFEDPVPPVHPDPIDGDEVASFFSAFPFTEPEEEEEEDETQGEPVTGSGNEDLWPVGSRGGQR